MPPLAHLLGRRPVVEALRAGRDVRRILLSAAAREEGALAELLKLADERGVEVRRVPPAELDRLAGGESHQGVVALAAALPDLDVADVLARAAQRGEPPFLILLDHVEDPHNVGAILRVADGAGAHAVVVPRRGAAGLTPGAVKSSAGASEHVPVVEVGNLMEALQKLKKADVWIAAADAEKGKIYWNEKLTGPLAIVMGSEGHGISHPIAKHCDFFVRIPLAGALGSLNVSTATAVLAFERRRQMAQEGKR